MPLISIQCRQVANQGDADLPDGRMHLIDYQFEFVSDCPHSILTPLFKHSESRA